MQKVVANCSIPFLNKQKIYLYSSFQVLPATITLFEQVSLDFSDHAASGPNYYSFALSSTRHHASESLQFLINGPSRFSLYDMFFYSNTCSLL